MASGAAFALLQHALPGRGQLWQLSVQRIFSILHGHGCRRCCTARRTVPSQRALPGALEWATLRQPTLPASNGWRRCGRDLRR